MRSGVAFALAITLAGCGQKSPQVSENQQGANEKTTAVPENAPVIEANAASASAAAGSQLGSLPPADAAPRFVGTWATSQANCGSKPWRFTAEDLTTEDGPRCSFYKVRKVAGGYDLAAECPTKEPLHTDLIKLRFAESARAMLLESNAIPPTGLVYCGS